MTIHVTIGKDEIHLSELMAAAQRGEEVLLDTVDGHRVRLTPVIADIPLTEEQVEARAAKRRAAFGMWRDKYETLQDLDLSVFKTSDEEIEERYRRKFGDLR